MAHRSITPNTINPRVTCRCGTLTWFLDEKLKPICCDCMIKRMQRETRKIPK